MDLMDRHRGCLIPGAIWGPEGLSPTFSIQLLLAGFVTSDRVEKHLSPGIVCFLCSDRLEQRWRRWSMPALVLAFLVFGIGAKRRFFPGNAVAVFCQLPSCLL